MSAEILLDPVGDLPAPPDVRVIETEVDFLRLVLTPHPLLIRGERLCAWAEAFYTLRGQPVRVVESPTSILRRAFPPLSAEQARELAQKIGKNYLSAEEVSSAFVLNACFPSDYTIWQGTPSHQHAASWLLWLLGHTPTEAESIVLKEFASEMKRRSGEAPYAKLYDAENALQAKAWLWRWLGAEEPPISDLNEFPLELPSKILNAIRDDWVKRIVATNGDFFAEMMPFPLPLALRQELARLTANYYQKNAYQLTRTALQKLSPYLDSQTLTSLEKVLPPSVPAALPEEEDSVLDWFEHHYLPYRRWQAAFGDKTAHETVVSCAQAFSRWLLERYPRWLLDGDRLAFQKSARLVTPNALTFCVILDGLPAWDAEWLVQELSAHVPRLTLLQKSYCFSAIPTITEFAKEALLKGVPPQNAPQTTPIGKILPDNRSPKNHLQEALAGQVWFWRVEQPDKAYHFEQDDKRERQVRAELQVIVDEIEKVVNEVPDTLRLNILLTSDHGRLMNPRVSRRLQVDAEMQAHGRVAWGNFQRAFPETGYIVSDNAEYVELYGERFGITHNLRIAWSEACFGNDARTEAYPHGGLFPEEVIVPWFIFERDAQAPEIEIRLTGKGEADMSGEVTIEVLNHSPLMLECQEIIFSHGAKLNGPWLIERLKETTFKTHLTPWPNKSNAASLTATFLFSQPNGVTFTRQVSPVLQIETLYESPDALLKDLDL